MRRARVCVRWAIASLLLVFVGACASAPRDASLPVSDPNEQTNRQILAANQAVLSPVAEVVKAATPGPVRNRLHDLNSNLKEPRIFVNNVLQLRFDAALHTAGRFVVNSTFGIGGLVDLASMEGLPQESGDFGQTLFVWGVSEGPYVMRPYLGPSTLRDAVGSTVDLFGDPLGMLIGTQLGVAIATTSLDAAVRLSELKAAEDSSIDFYSFLRSGYYQTRRAQLREAVGQPNVIELAGDVIISVIAAASLPYPRYGAGDNVLRPSARQTGPADPGSPREPVLTAK